MKPALEAIPWADGTSSLLAYRRAERQFGWSWHYHPEFELTLITHGSGTRLVGDHREDYHPGDLVLLGPNLPHTWFSDRAGRTSKAHQAMVIQFLPGAFPPEVLAMPEFRAVGVLLSRAAQGVRFNGRAAQKFGGWLQSLPGLRGAAAWAQLAVVLAGLAGSESTTLAGASYRNRRSFKMGSRLSRVMERIEAGSDGPLSLGDAARFAGLAPTSFARFFRRMTGRTFVEYRNGCRIRNACRLLVETDQSVVDVALASGFGNLAHFNRCFRETLGMPPRQYRRQWSKPG